LLGLLDELLGHGDHRGHLFGTGDADMAWGLRGGGRRRRGVAGWSCVELVYPLTGLSQLLALLLDQLSELMDLARETLEEVVDLVDVVTSNPDFEGHRIDGVQR
jgi:hypothetical protein